MTPVPPCRPVTVLAFAGDRSRPFIARVFAALVDGSSGPGPPTLECLLLAGHAGVSTDEGATISGFNPDAVIGQMKDRLERDSSPRQEADLWSAACLLMGLHYEQALIQMLLRGVRTMKESVTYMATIEEGEALGFRKMLLRLGRSRFGEQSPQVVTTLNALTDLSRLEELGDRLLHVSSWEELLGLNGQG